MLARFIRRSFCQTAQTTFANNCTLETDTESLKRQLVWRASNLGMRELDLLIGTYAKEKLKGFTNEELIKFNTDVLIHETPTLSKYLVGQIPLPEGNKYLPILIEYGKSRPKYAYF